MTITYPCVKLEIILFTPQIEAQDFLAQLLLCCSTESDLELVIIVNSMQSSFIMTVNSWNIQRMFRIILSIHSEGFLQKVMPPFKKKTAMLISLVQEDIDCFSFKNKIDQTDSKANFSNHNKALKNSWPLVTLVIIMHSFQDLIKTQIDYLKEI